MFAFIRGVVEFLFAELTLVWFFAKVQRSDVALHVAFPRETLMTVIALVRFFLQMSCLVHRQIMPLDELFSTQTASIPRCCLIDWQTMIIGKSFLFVVT